MAMPAPIKIVVKKAANAVSLFLNMLVFLHPTDGVSRQFAWRPPIRNRTESQDLRGQTIIAEGH